MDIIDEKSAAEKFIKFYTIIKRKPFNKEKVKSYLGAIEKDVDSIEAVMAEIVKGTNDMAVIMAENQEGFYKLVNANSQEAKNGISAEGAFSKKDLVDNSKSTSESATLAKKEKSSSTARITIVDTKKDLKKTMPVKNVSMYDEISSSILKVVPTGRYLRRYEILEAASTNGINTGNWLTLIRYLLKGNNEITVSHNNEVGNKKRYIFKKIEKTVDIPKIKISTDKIKDNVKIIAENPAGGSAETVVKIPESAKSIVITIKIDIGN
jgi:hypothetical protein